jgi:NAD(P)H-dependent flavin oxidoreductase YrpB (nitropropane dioxygenase family)
VLLPEGIGEAPPPDISIAELKKQFVPQPHMDFVGKMAAEYGVVLKEAKTDMVLSVEHSKKQIQVMLEEKVPLYCAGLGIPDWLVPMAHEGGMKVLGLAGNVRGAMRHKKAGADFIVAQGHEAGGHTGRIGTLALVPQVVDAVKPTPVVAAGGIGDGRGLVAALALGAVGVWVGTAFLFAEEANIIDVHRKALIAANEEDTRISRVWSGKTLRQMKNPIQEAFDNSGLKPLPVIIQVLLMLDLIDSLAKAKRHDLLCSPVGQIAGMLKDVRPAKDILNDMVKGAVEILDKKLPTEVKTKS